MRVSSRRLTVGIATGMLMLGLSAAPAAADHAHFIYQPAQGNHPATCRYIAAGQTQKAADEPGGHAFHERVHTGRPGSDDRGTDFDKETNAANYVCVWANTP